MTLGAEQSVDGKTGRLTGAQVLARYGIAAEPAPARSAARFPDGADFRIEIPSVEGPAVLRAVVEQAAAEGITVNRVSQGSGAMLLSAAELAELSAIGADHGLEVSLFVGPREEWDIGSLAQSPEGPSRSGLIRGARQLRYAVDDVLRGVEHGIRGFLVADTGLLEVLAGMQRDGEIPASVVWKVSAMLAPANPVTARQLERLGGHTVNVPSDLTAAQLAELRAATSLPIDLYVEAPSSMGGVVRGHEAADLVAAAAPMYVKFGLRNSRPLYPSGLHLVGEAVAIAREKVHRARVALEWMDLAGLELVQSAPGAPGLGIPERRLMTAPPAPKGRAADWTDERRAQRGARREGGGPAPKGARRRTGLRSRGSEERATERRGKEAGFSAPGGARLRSDAWFRGDDEVALAHRVAFAAAGHHGHRRRRPPGHRHRQLGQRAEPVQPAAAGPGGRGGGRHPGGRWRAGRVRLDLARRGPDEAERDALPEPARHRDRGDHPEQPAGRDRAAGRLRQDRARRDHGRGQRRPADGGGDQRRTEPATFRGRRIGSGSDLWRLWDERRAGRSTTRAGASWNAAWAAPRAPATRWAPRPPWPSWPRRSG